jgi:AcrR family transcriptional regulator
MGRPTIPLLSHQLIVETALDIIDRDGAAALSMRRLASQLGVSSPSLYHHFATKDDILDAVSEHIAADVRHVHSATWQDVLREFAFMYREVMTAHPNAVEFMSFRPVRHRAALGAYEWQLRELTEKGWDLQFAWEILLNFEQLVMGAALQAGGPELQLSDPELREQFSLLAEAGDLGHMRPRADLAFMRAVDDMIAGIEERLRREPRPRATNVK